MIKKFFLLLLAIVFVIGFDTYRNIGNKPTKEELKTFEKLSYFNDGEFVSLLPITYEPEKVRNGPAGLLRFFTKSKFAPENNIDMIALDKNSFAETPEDFAVYWLGHSSAVMDFDGKRFVIDPVLGNAAPLFFAAPRFDVSPITYDDLPQSDCVLITHNHYDHLERKSIVALKDSHFVVPLGVKSALVGWGVNPDNVTELGWGGKYDCNGVVITAVEGVHYSGRTRADKNKTLWNSYALVSFDKKIFWGGDTGYSKHFAKIGEEFGGFDFVALEIDGWNPAWKRTHLFPHEVIKATKDLGAKTLLPIHWGVFDLALHPWHESIDMVIEEAKNTGIDVKTPKMGEKINEKSQTKPWWL